MSFATVARTCATRGANSVRSSRRLPAVSAGNAQPASIRAAPRRFMGGGGQPVSQSMEAELWQGHPKTPEGWETTIYLTYGATAVIFVALAFAPDTSITTVSELMNIIIYLPSPTLCLVICIYFNLYPI